MKRNGFVYSGKEIVGVYSCEMCIFKRLDLREKGGYMHKWEYLYLVSAINEDGDWIPQRINGKELPDWASGPGMYEVTNELGEQGWELVNIAVSDIAYRSVIKRTKE